MFRLGVSAARLEPSLGFGEFHDYPLAVRQRIDMPAGIRGLIVFKVRRRYSARRSQGKNP